MAETDDASPLKNFGANVRQRREALGFTQEHVAGLVGLNVSYLASLERGLRNPSLKSSLWIAHALEAELSDLVQGLGVDGLAPPKQSATKGPRKTPWR